MASSSSSPDAAAATRATATTATPVAAVASSVQSAPKIVRAPGEGHRAQNRGRTAEDIAAQKERTIAAAKAEGLRKKAEYAAKMAVAGATTTTGAPTTIASSTPATTTVSAKTESKQSAAATGKATAAKKKKDDPSSITASSTVTDAPAKKKELSDEVDHDLAHGGASPWGNFHQYYSFNPAGERIRHLPAYLGRDIASSTTTNTATDDSKTSLEEITYLDIGCNEGDLTLAVTHHLATTIASHLPIRTLGVDIDSVLIDRAALKPVPPRPSSTSSSSSATPTDDGKMSVMFRCCDVMKSTDVTTHVAPFISTGVFTLVTAFSVTLWVHLHHGDSGLQQLLHWLADHCHHMLIEPQPWKCYKTAIKRWGKAGARPPAYATLKWRNNVDTDIITYLTTHCDMRVHEVLGETKWSRKVVWLTRRSMTMASSTPPPSTSTSGDTTAAAPST